MTPKRRKGDKKVCEGDDGISPDDGDSPQLDYPSGGTSDESYHDPPTMDCCTWTMALLLLLLHFTMLAYIIIYLRTGCMCIRGS